MGGRLICIGVIVCLGYELMGVGGWNGYIGECVCIVILIGFYKVIVIVVIDE